MEQQPLLVTAFRLSQILAFDSLELRLGSALTLAEGPNGAGKTTLIRALAAGLEGGRVGRMVRNGQTEGEIVLEFSNGYHLERHYRMVTGADGATSQETTVELLDPDGRPVPRVQEFLRQLYDPMSFRPVAFLSASPKQRLEWLLENASTEVTKEEVEAATGFQYAITGRERNGLELVAALTKEFDKERLGIEREVKSKRTTVEQLERALPPSSATPDETPDEVRLLERGLNAEREEAARAVTAQYRKRREEASAKSRKTVDDLQARILELQTEISKEKASGMATLRELDRQEQDARAEALAPFEDRDRDLTARAARAAELAAQNSRAAATRDTVATLRAEVAEFELNAAAYVGALAGLRDLRASLMQRIPIPGLEISDGDITIDGIPFDDCNEARRVEFVLQLALQRKGLLGFVVFDRFESLDPGTFRAFVDAAPRMGVQLVVTRVSACPTHGEHYDECTTDCRFLSFTTYDQQPNPPVEQE